MSPEKLEKIKKYALEKYSAVEGSHGIEHVERVSQNALRIVEILDLTNRIDKNLLEAICLLHDILMIKNKRNTLRSLYNHIFEKRINKNNLHKIVEGFDFSDNEERILIRAIINHPYSIPYHILNRKKDIYSKILQDADSIDYISTHRLKEFNERRWYMYPISIIFIFIIRKNIKHFLNFPELARYIDRF